MSMTIIATEIDIRDITFTVTASVEYVKIPPVPARIADSDWDAQGTDELSIHGFTVQTDAHLYYGLINKYGAKLADEVFAAIEEAFRNGNWRFA